jgi:hypothetical protein
MNDIIIPQRVVEAKPRGQCTKEHPQQWRFLAMMLPGFRLGTLK